MTLRALHLRLGLFALVTAALLALLAIPGWVSSPSNVRVWILSPTFWPYTLAGLTALVGAGLLATAWHADAALPADADAPPDPQGAPGWARLAALAAIMVATMALLSWLGMVWTTMLAFLATAFLFRTRHPVAAVICAVAVPFLLYAFFAHVAGIAVPQGELVRLP